MVHSPNPKPEIFPPLAPEGKEIRLMRPLYSNRMSILRMGISKTREAKAGLAGVFHALSPITLNSDIKQISNGSEVSKEASSTTNIIRCFNTLVK